MTPSLFNIEEKAYRPLADLLRPRRLDEIVGQGQLLNPQGAIRQMLDKGRCVSMILWGPPGSGKTSLAHLIAAQSGCIFVSLSATLSGVAELRKIFTAAEAARQEGQNTCLFIDEIHRFHKGQQDSFLPYVESGCIILIGATTENPGFELNSALLSRCRVFVLEMLGEQDLEVLLKRAETIMGAPLPIVAEARRRLLAMSDGDARYLLNMVESLYGLAPPTPLSLEGLADFLQKRTPLYDKSGDSHYNLMSALHKSLRASDCDASLYWLARMLNGGEDPLYILRRLSRFAYEDIGLADPNAAAQALHAYQYYQRLGSPEGELACAYLVIYLATAPKSNNVYKAFKAAMHSAQISAELPPPKHLLNAPTKLAKDLNYGKDYQYDHDHDNAFSGQNCFPDALPRQQYYQPNLKFGARGFERQISKRLEYWNRLRQQKNTTNPEKL